VKLILNIIDTVAWMREDGEIGRNDVTGVFWTEIRINAF